MRPKENNKDSNLIFRRSRSQVLYETAVLKHFVALGKTYYLVIFK